MLPQSIVDKIGNVIEDALPGVKYIVLYCDEIGAGNTTGTLTNIPDRSKLNLLLQDTAEAHNKFRTEQDKIFPS